MSRNLPRPEPIPDDVNRGLDALEVAVTALADEVSLAHAIEKRVCSALDLGKLIDGQRHLATDGEFTPWGLYHEDVWTAAAAFSNALDETYAEARIAYALASGRALVAAYSNETPKVGDLQWATTVELTYAALKEAFDSVTPPPDLPMSLSNVPQAYSQVRASLDDLFNGMEARESADKIETILSFGRVYAPDPAEDCLNAIGDFATSARMHLQDALREATDPIDSPTDSD